MRYLQTCSFSMESYLKMFIAGIRLPFLLISEKVSDMTFDEVVCLDLICAESSSASSIVEYLHHLIYYNQHTCLCLLHDMDLK